MDKWDRVLEKCCLYYKLDQIKDPVVDDIDDIEYNFDKQEVIPYREPGEVDE